MRPVMEYDCKEDYPLSPVLELYSKRSLQNPPADSIVCRRCPNAEWIVEKVEATEFGDDTVCRAWCAALGRFMWPNYKVEACDARLRAIKAERRGDTEDGANVT